jgi:hypothetical protein
MSTISTTLFFIVHSQWMKSQFCLFHTSHSFSCSLLLCDKLKKIKKKHPQFVVVFENFTLILMIKIILNLITCASLV